MEQTIRHGRPIIVRNQGDFLVEQLANDMIKNLESEDVITCKNNTVILNNQHPSDFFQISENNSINHQEKGVRIEAKMNDFAHKSYVAILEQIQRNHKTYEVVYDYLEKYSSKDSVSFRGISASIYSEQKENAIMSYFQELHSGWLLYDKNNIKIANANQAIDFTSSNFIKKLQNMKQELMMKNGVSPNAYALLSLKYQGNNQEYSQMVEGDCAMLPCSYKAQEFTTNQFRENLDSISRYIGFLSVHQNEFCHNLLELLNMPSEISVLPIEQLDAIKNVKQYQKRKSCN